MTKLTLIKLGGSLITDKGQEFTAKPETILRLALEIKESQKKSSGKIVLAHGSGSFAHVPAAKYKTKEGLIDQASHSGLPIVADAAIQINRIVMKELLKANLPAVSFSPASFMLAQKRKLKKMFTDALELALEKDFLPVIYGDIVFDTTQGFCIFSADTSLPILATYLQKHYDHLEVIFCSDTDGVYDSQNFTIPEITPQNFTQVKKFITGSTKTDVTGGMILKVSESLELAKKGIPVKIINGNRENELYQAILGQPTSGTLIHI